MDNQSLQLQIGKLSAVGVILPDGFNPKLVARIGLQTTDNMSLSEMEQIQDRDVVCFIEDGEFSLDNQYSTPFENSNPEGRMPTLMGMLQSGQATQTLYQIGSVFDIARPDDGAGDGEKQGFLSQVADGLDSVKGRTTFTKLNSHQIFTSSNSVKISATLVFSAWEDAKREVEMALKQLQAFAVPRFLADKTALMSGLQEQKFQGFFPSEIPPKVFLSYGGKRYNDLVIESLSAPIVAPMNEHGDRITVRCQISLLSVQAWDRQDVLRLYG